MLSCGNWCYRCSGCCLLSSEDFPMAGGTKCSGVPAWLQKLESLPSTCSSVVGGVGPANLAKAERCGDYVSKRLLLFFQDAKRSYSLTVAHFSLFSSTLSFHEQFYGPTSPGGHFARWSSGITQPHISYDAAIDSVQARLSIRHIGLSTQWLNK